MNEQVRKIIEALRQDFANIETIKMEQAERHHQDLLEGLGNIANELAKSINNVARSQR